ncbi:VTC domain-containing protein [Promethearchaeum syntrophicum]|uniref:VTC domain-containing protein n=1 Tax=Promethearchaeum syntrophicum TaxID=2594042 RepID=A0A5B9DG09_9ARCH|nr:polyphosphate polymerase domain-containing protein [Candidatus Prometheoarchaeum syntrophicum]
MVRKYFKRFEIKYPISMGERDRLVGYLRGFMNPDKYIQLNLDYEIRSLYFDSPQRKAYYEKVNGVKYRKKLRIRYYPNSKQGGQDYIFIEIKRKINENVSKARILVPARHVFQIIDGNSKIASELYQKSSITDRNILEEIWYLKKRFNLKPVCAISYKRQALTGIFEKNFRVTFDTNLRVSRTNFDLLQFSAERSKLIIPQTQCVMEVKFNNIIPKWAIKIVQANNCVQQKISKFASGVKTVSYCLL